MRRRPLFCTLLLVFVAACGSSTDGSTARSEGDPPPSVGGSEAPPPANDPDESEVQDTDDAEIDDADTDEADELFPDVVAAEATSEGDESWSFSVTLSSPYDTPSRYADSWRVRNADGSIVYGERFLTHDHAGEQPFTRSQNGIEIPDDVATVIIEGRDQESGWGGETLELTLDRS